MTKSLFTGPITNPKLVLGRGKKFFTKSIIFHSIVNYETSLKRYLVFQCFAKHMSPNYGDLKSFTVPLIFPSSNNHETRDVYKRILLMPPYADYTLKQKDCHLTSLSKLSHLTSNTFLAHIWHLTVHFFEHLTSLWKLLHLTSKSFWPTSDI